MSIDTTLPPETIDESVEYPSGDGKPVAETPLHRDNLIETIPMLRKWYAGRDDVYISGNMMMYYVQGNPRKSFSADNFVVEGIPNTYRHIYQTWMEPKPTIDFVIEYTSKSTRRVDLKKKFKLYRDVLKVREYVLFDPLGEYLDPPQRLYRLVDGDYEMIEPVDGRLPSDFLGLHIDRSGRRLRLWVPDTGLWIPTDEENAASAVANLDRALADRDRVAADRDRVAADRERLAEELERAAQARREAAAEIEHLRRENERLRGGAEESR